MMSTVLPVNYPEMIVEKSGGLTISEQKLVFLGYQTFLRLWSYPNPYKLQKNGKELCDLLIVFDNQIIIFSDKDCAYGDTSDSKVDWKRWYRKAIQKSAEQLVGARNWIIRYPDKVAVDAKCTKRLPLEIKITEDTKFHLIAIAHGAAEPCKKYFSGGDGGLVVNNSIIGNKHICEDCEPFCVGRVFDDPQTFIHVFDDASYINVLHELDTIQDFLRYLEARQELLTKKRIIAESESDMLAQHLKGVMKGKPHFLQELCKAHTDIYFEGGLFEELKFSQVYSEWKNKIKKSYFWDELLQKTFFFIENGLSETTTSPTIQEQSELFKLMAREDRFRRYALSEGFLSFFAKTTPDQTGTRVLYNIAEPEVCYILFLLPRKEYMSDVDYRRIRKDMLMDYCAIVKVEYPEALHIIGVAHESAEGEYTSEDFVYLDAREWSDEQQAKALDLKAEYEFLGLLGKRTMTPRTFFPYKQKMKGRDRNKPCPCGSGKKFKNCCGK